MVLMNALGFALILLREFVIGATAGTLFIKCDLFKRLKVHEKLLVGIGVSPFFVALCNYAFGLVFIGVPTILFWILPFALCIGYLAYKKNYKYTTKSIADLFRSIISFIRGLGNWAWFIPILSTIVVCYFALWFNGQGTLGKFVKETIESFNQPGLNAFRILQIFFAAFILVSTYFMIRRKCLASILFSIILVSTIGTVVFSGFSLINREVLGTDFAHYEVEARYFTEDKNSWTIDNYQDERAGSSFQDDHGPLWIAELADARLTAEILNIEEPLQMINFSNLTVYLLFFLMLYLTAKTIAKSWKAGAVAICLFHYYNQAYVIMMGTRDGFRMIGLLLLLLYCVDIIEEIISRKANYVTYIYIGIFSFLCMQGHASNVYLLLGIFLLMGIILIVNKISIKELLKWAVSVFLGTLVGISKTIYLYLKTGSISSSTALVFKNTPVYDQINSVGTSQQTQSSIWASYTPYIRWMFVIGLIGLLFLIVYGYIRQNRYIRYTAFLTLGLLLPITGLMDWLGYKCSIYFLSQYRYVMYIVMLAALMAACMITIDKGKWINNLFAGFSAAIFGLYIYLQPNVMVTMSRNLNENWIAEEYKAISATVDQYAHGNVFLQDQIMLYYLNGSPKLLFDEYSRELIQAKTQEEVKKATEDIDVSAIIITHTGVDYHDYSLLPFWEYINESGAYTKVDQSEWNGRIGFVIYYRNEQPTMN